MGLFMKKFAAALAMSLGLFSSVQASTLSFTSIDNGWYNQSGTHTAGNSNIITGWFNGQVYNSYFNFKLSGLKDVTIKSATLTIKARDGNYNSPDSSEQVEIWDVTSTPGQGSSSKTIFNDLMTGTKYGQATVSGTRSNPMPQVVITLDSAAYADILADNAFSVGAHLASIGHTNIAEETLWSDSSGLGAATLSLEVQPNAVPEPSTLALVGIACAGLGAMRRRKSA